MSCSFSTLLNVFIETKKKHHLLKIDRSHCIAILLKLLKGLELVSSLHNIAKIELEIFVINCTNVLMYF